ncbi:MAG: choline/ethanolamine kinase family protein [Bacilli bacterium]
MENKDVILGFNKILNIDNGEFDHRLLGGMSNYTFVMKVNNDYYTYRIPGDFAEVFVDRDIEVKNIKIMESLGISNETLLLDTKTGEKVAKYIPGSSMHTLSEFPLKKVSDLLKKIHNSGIHAENDYDPFGRLNKYEKEIINLGFVHKEDYLKTKQRFMAYKDFLDSQPKVLIHGDSQPSNFIVNNDNLSIVDFEFTGNNDLVYDIACFANMKLEHGLELLYTYFDEVDTVLLKRFYLWRTFQALQWFNVAVFKDLKGMSEKLKIDFNMVSNKYLQLATSLIEKVENI